MADVVLTLQEAEDLFWSLTLQTLGLNPAAPASQKRVRIGWLTKGAPAWKIDEDVAFLLLNYNNDPINRQVDVAYLNQGTNYAKRVQSYTRVLTVTWVCYGPSSFDDADKIRSELFHPRTKETLLRSNLAMILDVEAPIRTPELFGGQWWERTTFSARFNELVTRSSDVAYIESANVQIVKE
ncbi:hypothetical protein [Paenibacillus sp. GCM10012303]|uniref:phage neck terminator protein n=1 Tax=Paenibacillus sp. GCM10012303 TaxID=3317340 RepID=UPI0036239F8C